MLNFRLVVIKFENVTVSLTRFKDKISLRGNRMQKKKSVKIFRTCKIRKDFGNYRAKRLKLK